MPNKDAGHKPPKSQKRPRNALRARRGHSVKALLDRSPGAVFGRISSQKTAQDAWRAWLAERLSGDLMARISGLSERDGVLTVFTESAAWSARIRYVLEEARAAGEDAPPIKVRVMPRG